MTQAPITIRVDHRRLEQLKAVAAALNVSVAGAISHFIREKISTGLIPENIPGISVEKLSDGVEVSIDGNRPLKLSKSGAGQFVDTIRAVVGRRQPSIVNIDLDFAVLRRGSGFRIQAPFVTPENSFPADLAHDLADLVEKAAA